jgi:hypothetical protein
MPKLATPINDAKMLSLVPSSKRYKIGDERGLYLLIGPKDAWISQRLPQKN